MAEWINKNFVITLIYQVMNLKLHTYDQFNGKEDGNKGGGAFWLVYWGLTVTYLIVYVLIQITATEMSAFRSTFSLR